MLDFLLATVAYRHIEAQTCWCVEKAHLAGLDYFVWHPFIGDALVGRARSIMATDFLNSELEIPYMIFIDADIVFEPEDLHRISDHLHHGYDLVGGVYIVRGGTQMAHYSHERVPADGKIHKVDYLSTGFMGIARKLLLKMKDELELPLLHENTVVQNYPFFESGRHTSEEHGSIYISEDWDFCNKAKQVGTWPYLDTSIMLGHIGHKEWRVRDMLRYRKEKAERDPEPDPHQLLDFEGQEDANL